MQRQDTSSSPEFIVDHPLHLLIRRRDGQGDATMQQENATHAQRLP
jgi:hypothetical protein